MSGFQICSGNHCDKIESFCISCSPFLLAPVFLLCFCFLSFLYIPFLGFSRNQYRTNKTCIYTCIHHTYGASLVAQPVKNPPAMWETWVFFFSFLPLHTISMAVLGFPRSRTSKISIYIVSIIRIYVHMSIYVHTYAHLVKELLCRIDSCCCGG